jgi:hypothetical protein
LARKITFPTFFPRVFGVQYFGQGFIANLPIKGVTPPYHPTIMAVGERIYLDNTPLIMESHFDFKRVALIRTFSSHKDSTESKAILIQTKEPTRVWVAYDEKGSSDIPTWLKQKFKRTGRRIKSNQGLEFQLYKIDMRAGELSLGGNAKGVRKPGHQYFVIIENLKNENVVITRDVIDTTVDEIKYTSDNLIQLFTRGMLVHNVYVDPGIDLYLNNNQFEQNGLSILNVNYDNEPLFTPTTEALNYDVVTSGPTVTGGTVVFRYPELVDSQIVIRERIDPVIIPAQVTHHSTTHIVNEIDSLLSFEEKVDQLNVGIDVFEPAIETFTPTPRQPKSGQSFLTFTEQEPLVNPDIEIYGSRIVQSGHETTVYWESINSSRIMMDQKEIDFKGFIDTILSSTKSYIFEVEADDEVLVKNFVIQVADDTYPTLQSLPELTLKSDKKMVDKGDTITLTWSASNVTHLFLDDQEVSLSGSQTFTIDDNTEFTLKGTNSYITTPIKLLIRITPEQDPCC